MCGFYTSFVLTFWKILRKEMLQHGIDFFLFSAWHSVGPAELVDSFRFSFRQNGHLHWFQVHGFIYYRHIKCQFLTQAQQTKKALNFKPSLRYRQITRRTPPPLQSCTANIHPHKASILHSVPNQCRLQPPPHNTSHHVVCSAAMRSWSLSLVFSRERLYTYLY